MRWLWVLAIVLGSFSLLHADDARTATGEELFQKVDKEIRDQVPAMLREGLKEVTVEMGIPYVDRPSGPVKLDIYRSSNHTSAEPKPAVIVIHGGSWKSGDRRQLGLYAASLARRGYIAFAIEYRLAPKHPWPAQWEDVRDAVIYVRSEAKKLGVDPDRIGAVGYSAGGHLASMLAVNGAKETSASAPKISAKVSCAAAGGAPCDFSQMPLDNNFLKYWLGATRKENPDVYLHASPLRQVSNVAAPTFFYNGLMDFMVRPNSAADLSKSLKNLGIDTAQHLVPGAGHITAALDEKALTKAWAFLDKHLKPVGPKPPVAESAKPAPAEAATTGK